MKDTLKYLKEELWLKYSSEKLTDRVYQSAAVYLHIEGKWLFSYSVIPK